MFNYSVGAKFGISGPYWYAAGATIQGHSAQLFVIIYSLRVILVVFHGRIREQCEGGGGIVLPKITEISVI